MSYYKETMPQLIKELKKMVKESLNIVGDKIDGDLADDKMHNVIRSKKMAAENVVWGTQEIDRLEEELNKDPNKKEKVFVENFADSRAT